MTSDETSTPTGNHLIDALSASERDAVVSNCETVSTELKYLLFERDETIEDVWFPIDAVASIVSDMDAGTIEIATIGNEGMVGVPVFLGAESMNARCFVQIPGRQLQMRASDFRKIVSNGGELHGLVQRYTQALFAQLAQNTACNRLHSVDERCARWLLQTQDRIERDDFPLTQEFLGQMLGVRRATVNTAASMLQQAGFIRYSRGRITVTDRRGLESAACECYGIVRREFERLIGNA